MAQFSDYIRILRPSQWYKNFLIPAVGIFSFQVFEPSIYGYLMIGFILASGLSGTNYIFNDIMDINQDRLHPTKRYRPIASGTVSKKNAVVLGVAIFSISLIFSFLLNIWFGIIMSIFFLISQLYTFILKRIVIVDILTISVNFILRGLGGLILLESFTSVLKNPPGAWEFWAVFVLALFLVVSKRRVDLQQIEQENVLNCRTNSSLYSKKMLDQLIFLISAIFLMGYYLYVILTDTTGGYLLLTIPVATYLMFRYLYLLFSNKKPLLTTKTPVKDPGMIIGSVVVLILFLTIKYLGI